MKTFSEKVRDRRAALSLSQKELAAKAGIGERTLVGYEAGVRTPRPGQLYKLAEALGVTTEYLRDDTQDDPNYGMDRMGLVEEMRSTSGQKDALDLEAMLRENQAMFAGGEVSEEAKEAYFQAIMRAYLDCKEAAAEKYRKKKA